MVPQLWGLRSFPPHPEQLQLLKTVSPFSGNSGHSSTLDTPHFLWFTLSPCAWNIFALPGFKHTGQESQQAATNTMSVTKPGRGAGTYILSTSQISCEIEEYLDRTVFAVPFRVTLNSEEKRNSDFFFSLFLLLWFINVIHTWHCLLFLFLRI